MFDTSPKKKRDSEATRRRILESAQIVFTQKGYENAGTRDIANHAGVNIALIKRYFGSKKNLFCEAVLSYFEVSFFEDIENENLPEFIAETFVNKPEKDTFDPTLALLRSSGSPEVKNDIQKTVTNNLIIPLSKKLGGEKAIQKASLLLSAMSGFDVVHRVIGIAQSGEFDSDGLKERFANVIASTLIDSGD